MRLGMPQTGQLLECGPTIGGSHSSASLGRPMPGCWRGQSCQWSNLGFRLTISGSSPCHGTLDQLYTLYRVLGDSGEFSQLAHMHFVDLEKAFNPLALTLRDRVRSSAIWEDLRAELLLLHIERSQLKWLGHLFQMPPVPDASFGRCFRHIPLGEGQGDSSEHTGGTMSVSWPGNTSGFHQESCKRCRGEGSLGIPAESAATTTQSQITGRRQVRVRGHVTISIALRIVV
ncbi:hypothetical protein ATANTOWER_029593 [Ataeniobius toweri]|uniref:Uncharacterized protein n=1 Tax=Ataeniobius toweri TaxID=208326 RepID=A0ABU7A9A9_9TELE|nr:hypothetical protein [Ataeniobius toweri]